MDMWVLLCDSGRGTLARTHEASPNTRCDAFWEAGDHGVLRTGPEGSEGEPAGVDTGQERAATGRQESPRWNKEGGNAASLGAILCHTTELPTTSDPPMDGIPEQESVGSTWPLLRSLQGREGTYTLFPVHRTHLTSYCYFEKITKDFQIPVLLYLISVVFLICKILQLFFPVWY